MDTLLSTNLMIEKGYLNKNHVIANTNNDRESESCRKKEVREINKRKFTSSVEEDNSDDDSKINNNVKNLKYIKLQTEKDQMFEIFQPWALKTYGDQAKTKTITYKKKARILRALNGKEQNNPDSSKFRFWVKSKGFTTKRPENFINISTDQENQDSRDKINNRIDLYVVSTKKNFGENNYKKVAIVEEFFNIIYTIHVDLGGRGNRHAGQKRTYRIITETYAFLPREAVTKFLTTCPSCKKNLRLSSSDRLEKISSSENCAQSKISKENSIDCARSITSTIEKIQNTDQYTSNPFNKESPEKFPSRVECNYYPESISGSSFQRHNFGNYLYTKSDNFMDRMNIFQILYPLLTSKCSSFKHFNFDGITPFGRREDKLLVPLHQFATLNSFTSSFPSYSGKLNSFETTDFHFVQPQSDFHNFLSPVSNLNFVLNNDKDSQTFSKNLETDKESNMNRTSAIDLSIKCYDQSLNINKIERTELQTNFMSTSADAIEDNQGRSSSFVVDLQKVKPITSTYLKMTRSLGLTDEDALRLDDLLRLPGKPWIFSQKVLQEPFVLAWIF